MDDEALEHLVQGIVEHPDDVTVRAAHAAPRPDARGPRPPRRPRQGHRTRRPYGQGAAHRHRRAEPRATASASTSSTSTRCAEPDAPGRRPHRSRPRHRGEVAVDVRTDEPETRLAPGAVLLTDPAERRAADDRDRPGPQRPAAADRSPASPTARPPRRCAAPCCSSTSTPTRRPRTTTSGTTTSWSGSTSCAPTAPRSARSARCCTCPATTCWPSTGAGRRARCSCRSSRRSSPRSTSPPAGWSSTPPPGLLDDPRSTPPRRDGSDRCASTSSRSSPSTSRRSDLSLLGKAREAGLLDVRVHDLRAYADDRHRTVDDTPYGGGAGMVMTPEPWGDALDALLADAAGDRRRRCPGCSCRPRPGRRFDQAFAARAGGRAVAGRRLRAVRGHRPRGSSTTRPSRVPRRRGLARRLRAGRRRGRRARHRRGGRPAAAGRARQRRLAGRGVARGRPAGVPRLHEAGQLARAATCPRSCSAATTAAIARWRRDEALRRTARCGPTWCRRWTRPRCDAADLRGAGRRWAGSPGPTAGFRRRTRAVSD